MLATPQLSKPQNHFIFSGTLWPSWVATETVYKLKQRNVKIMLL